MLLMIAIATPSYAKAEEENENNFRANFKRIAVDLSSVEVKNAEYYVDSPNSKLSADSKTVIKSVFDFVLEYEQPKWQWNNSLYMEYGRTEIKPVNDEREKTEDEDQILITTDYSYKMWHLEFDEAELGPFFNLGYETEFTKNNGAPREKVFRGKTGVKLFNGNIIKELYVAGVGEYDITYSNDKTTKFAYEVGIKLEKAISEQSKFELSTYFRDYISYSEYVGTDLKYEWNITGRFDTAVYKKCALGPYISYFQGESRASGKTGSNFMVGVSFSYANLFDLKK